MTQPTSLDYHGPAPSYTLKPGFWWGMIDRNPFYLLSAVCMLTGCILLSNATSWSPVSAYRIGALIFTLNLYELLLIGIAFWLLRRPDLGQNRDGAILVGIEAFFLVDLTWLNGELFAIDLKLGAMVNAVLLVLAFCKLAVIWRGIGRDLVSASFVFVMAQVILLTALPGVFKAVVQTQPEKLKGVLPAAAIYAAWWAVGMIPILAVILLRPATSIRAALAQIPYRRVVNVLMVFAFASIVLHLALFNWVYKVRWYNANVAPLVLGLAVAIGSYDRNVLTLATRMRIQLALPIVAMMLSARHYSTLVFEGPMTVTPLRLAFAGATLVYLHGLWLHRHAWFALATFACFGAVGLGASIDIMRQNVVSGWAFLTDLARKLTPRTSTHWGVISMVFAFLLLILGAVASAMKGRANDAPRMLSPNDREEQLMV